MTAMKKIFLILLMAIVVLPAFADGPQYKFLRNRNVSRFSGNTRRESNSWNDVWRYEQQKGVSVTPFSYSPEMAPVVRGAKLVSSEISIADRKEVGRMGDLKSVSPFRGKVGESTVSHGSVITATLKSSSLNEIELGHNGILAMSGSGVNDYVETGLLQPPKNSYEPPVGDGMVVMLVLALGLFVVKRFF